MIFHMEAKWSNTTIATSFSILVGNKGSGIELKIKVRFSNEKSGKHCLFSKIPWTDDLLNSDILAFPSQKELGYVRKISMGQSRMLQTPYIETNEKGTNQNFT